MCTIISTIVLVMAILWCRYYIGLPHIVKTALIILQGVCVIGDIWLAPVATTNKPITEKERRTYKLIAVILIIVYSLLSWKVEYIRAIVIFSLFIVFLATGIQRLLDVGTKKVNKNKKESNKYEKFMKIATTVLNSLALTLVISSANATCCWMFHQPEFPKEAEKFKKVH